MRHRPDLFCCALTPWAKPVIRAGFTTLTRQPASTQAMATRFAVRARGFLPMWVCACGVLRSANHCCSTAWLAGKGVKHFGLGLAIDQSGDVEFAFGDINPYDARGCVHRFHFPRIQALAPQLAARPKGPFGLIERESRSTYLTHRLIRLQSCRCLAAQPTSRRSYRSFGGQSQDTRSGNPTFHGAGLACLPVCHSSLP